jgi:hypothetical protein
MVPRRVVDADPNEPTEQKVRTPAAPSKDAPSGLNSSIARSSFSGGIESRPIGEYNAEKSPASAARASFTIMRIVRSG